MSYELVCVFSVGTGSGVRLIWERDGSWIDSIDNVLQLQLQVNPVNSVDQGHYTCRAEFLDSQTPNLPPVSAGHLSVLGKLSLWEYTVNCECVYLTFADGVEVPLIQVAAIGTTTRLNCSYPNGIITWFREEHSVDNLFSPVGVANEGAYVCDIYVRTSDGSSASTQVSIMFYVVGKLPE